MSGQPCNIRMKQEAVWSKLKGQIFLGSEEFLEQMEERLKGRHLDNVPKEQTQPTRMEKIGIILYL